MRSTLIGMEISLGACSVGLVYLASIETQAAPAIGIAFVGGMGVARWLCGEL